MSRVRIIGGGLTGILAAFQAHRMGLDDIELHERFDQLGGVALPDERHGLEMREGCIYFGPAGDPIRELLETYGQTFTDFDNRFGSLSPGGICTQDFGGPALPASDIALTPPTGPSLAERLACYPDVLARPLARYAQWHLGCDLGLVHESAAIPLAINRVFPTRADVAALAQAKRSDPLADELFAIPRGQWGRTANLTAALPTDGFPAFLRRTRRALEAIGVTIHDKSLVSPRQALAEHAAGEVLVWAANPTPLFKAAGVATPKLLPKSFATHVMTARWTGPLPFYVQNFTAEGACFRVYLYESGGQTLLTAECVAEAEPAALAAEIHGLLAGFEGDLTLGETLSSTIKARWIYHSVEAMERLVTLRETLADRMGPAFVAGAWEPYSKSEKFAQVNAGLAAALTQGAVRRRRMTRLAAIMQPTYLPYLGYFHLIAEADVFVFLDDVQFARRSWQQRNRIFGAGGEVMLSVPVQKTDREAAISEIEVADSERWREKHLASVRHAYGRRPHFAEGMAFLETELGRPATRLADLNCGIIEGAARKLGLKAEFVRASALGAPEHRSEHLLAICQATDATDYLSPMGSHDYMEDDGVFDAAGFPVRFQGFVEVAYPQGHEPFAPYMAFIDAVMNLGWAGTHDLIGAMRARS